MSDGDRMINLATDKEKQDMARFVIAGCALATELLGKQELAEKEQAFLEAVDAVSELILRCQAVTK